MDFVPLDIVGWLVGILAIPAVAWAIFVHIKLVNINSAVNRTLKMHYRPDDHGFGTGDTNKLIEENIRAIEQLTGLIQWLTKKQTGESPPPHIDS